MRLGVGEEVGLNFFEERRLSSEKAENAEFLCIIKSTRTLNGFKRKRVEILLHNPETFLKRTHRASLARFEISDHEGKGFVGKN